MSEHIDPLICDHPDFVAGVDVNRLQTSGRFVADVRVMCAACGTPFRFLGIPESGIIFEEPLVSAFGHEVHLPIEPIEDVAENVRLMMVVKHP